MKRIIFAFAFLFMGAIPVHAQFYDWEIDSFDSDILVNQDASIIVTETINADFAIDKHGIYRDIPVRYYDEFRQAKYLDIQVLSVLDANGNSWNFETSYQNGNMHIKIGDAAVYVTGKQTYAITYKVKGAIGYYDDHDELYWDVTGNDWFVPIHASSAAVHLHSGFTGKIAVKCFTGQFGSTEENCSSSQQGNTVFYEANDFLTIVAGWPKGVVQEPTQVQKFLGWLQNNWGFSLPVFVFILMYFVWLKKGKDPEDPPGLVTQYEPPDDLTPAEVGYLVSQKLKHSYLSAELVNLASKGFIHIKEELGGKFTFDDDYLLIKKKDFDDPTLKQHEREILKGVFLTKDERKISDIPASFYSKVSAIRKQILTQLKEKKYFDKDPITVTTKWLAVGIAVNALAFFFLPAQHIHYFIGLLLSGFVIIGFAFVMPRRTKAGVLALEYALGFKQYIEIAEDRRVKWEEQQNLFFRFLPYAMVFGIAKKWAKAFDGVFSEAPDWYEGDMRNFSALQFQRSLNVFSTKTSSNIRPPASSSSGFSSSSSGFSGGFSGGGGGGGGGGSW